MLQCLPFCMGFNGVAHFLFIYLIWTTKMNSFSSESEKEKETERNNENWVDVEITRVKLIKTTKITWIASHFNAHTDLYPFRFKRREREKKIHGNTWFSLQRCNGHVQISMKNIPFIPKQIWKKNRFYPAIVRVNDDETQTSWICSHSPYKCTSFTRHIQFRIFFFFGMWSV